MSGVRWARRVGIALGFFMLSLPALASPRPARASSDPSAANPQGSAQVIDLGVDGVQITGISADGALVSGYSSAGFVFRWSESGGLENLGPSDTSGKASISADGSVLSASIPDDEGVTQPALWQTDSGWQLLGSIPQGVAADTELATSFGLSRNGQHLAGLAWLVNYQAHGFVWNAIDGMRELPPLIAGSNCRANAVSDDGHITAGWTESDSGWWIGVRWIDGELEELVNDAGERIGEVVACSVDCSVMTGGNFSETDPATTAQAYRWTAATTQSLGVIAGAPEDAAYVPTAMTADGNAIVGTYRYWDGPQVRKPFLWTAQAGIRDLDEWLTELGVSGQDDWSTLLPTAISDDGRVIAGWGVRSVDGSRGSWYVRLPLADSIFVDGFEQ